MPRLVPGNASRWPSIPGVSSATPPRERPGGRSHPQIPNRDPDGSPGMRPTGRLPWGRPQQQAEPQRRFRSQSPHPVTTQHADNRSTPRWSIGRALHAASKGRRRTRHRRHWNRRPHETSASRAVLRPSRSRITYGSPVTKQAVRSIRAHREARRIAAVALWTAHSSDWFSLQTPPPCHHRALRRWGDDCPQHTPLRRLSCPHWHEARWWPREALRPAPGFPVIPPPGQARRWGRQANRLDLVER